MNRRTIISFAALSAFTSIFLPARSSFADGTNWWHSLSQTDRNQRIINRANTDLNRYVGLNCKQWVQRVVYEASGYHVWLPLTANNGNGWYWVYDPTGNTVNRCTSIRNVRRGEIVQINWKQDNGSWAVHTFIVTDVYSDRFLVIESNWGNGNYLTVKTRWVYFSEFESRTQGLYSIYYVR